MDFTFGHRIPLEPFGVAELIHNRTPDNYQRGRDKERGVIGHVMTHLKKAHYKFFDTLAQGFKFYDKVTSPHIP